jgi:hypothetical protein
MLKKTPVVDICPVLHKSYFIRGRNKTAERAYLALYLCGNAEIAHVCPPIRKKKQSIIKEKRKPPGMAQHRSSIPGGRSDHLYGICVRFTGALCC